MKVIVTGTTGMVGEGVLLECLQNHKVSDVLSISRKPCEINHPKLKELIVPDFRKLEDYQNEISGYDACFFCAGVSSVGMSEQKYTLLTYDTTLSFAKSILNCNPDINFCYVSGRGTDSSQTSKQMWARVKGKTENDLKNLGFTNEYNFRPAAMIPFPEQKHVKPTLRFLSKTFQFLFPKTALSLHEVGSAMVHAVERGYPKNRLEVQDIRELAKN